jgi:hypothetical protein
MPTVLAGYTSFCSWGWNIYLSRTMEMNEFDEKESLMRFEGKEHSQWRRNEGFEAIQRSVTRSIVDSQRVCYNSARVYVGRNSPKHEGCSSNEKFERGKKNERYFV